MTDSTPATAAASTAVAAVPDLLPEDDLVAADDSASESGYASEHSDTTSISSSIYAGFLENGRRYQSTRDGGYWAPSDEKQFESLQAAHLVHLILDSQNKNNLFYSPIPETVQNILDIGTGTGAWAVDVADRYPGAVVQGIDLYPPPDTWVPPNCKLEVDDVLKSWTFQKSFDFIHLRDLHGSFTERQWAGLYEQAYKNLAPGGWIEETETSIYLLSDDGTVAPDSLMAEWGPMFSRLCAKSERDIEIIDSFKSRIEAAGFINVQEKQYKVPIGEWTKNKVLREAGKFSKAQILSGMEGYTMYILTKASFGEPTPWQPEEVQIYLAKIRKEIDAPGLHSYTRKRRVWAQKPYDTQPKAEGEVEA